MDLCVYIFCLLLLRQIANKNILYLFNRFSDKMSFKIALNNIINKINKERITGTLSYYESYIAEKLYKIAMFGVRNNFVLLKNRGKLNLNGISFPFDKKNKRDVKSLLFFTKRYCVQFRNKNGYWSYNSKKNIILTPQGIKFYLDNFYPLIFAETFLYDIHFSDFNLDNKIVIQAGGFIGDTALYYAYRGAKVYSFEPEINSYRLALENIKLNPYLSKNIVMKNYAVGKDENIEFPVDPNVTGGASAYSVTKNKTINTRSVSISTILKEFSIKNLFLLDLDIKGKEFEVIRDSSISEFEMVRIEYSSVIDGKKVGSREDIIEALKRYGFNKIRIYKHNDGAYDLHEHGTIEARKS